MKKYVFTFVFVAVLITMTASDLLAKKVLVVQSYHKEYSWCQGVDEGIASVLKADGHEIKTFYMDTKRKTSNEWKIQSGQMAEDTVKNYQPDVIITVDDNAQAFFAKKFVGDNTKQIIFTGVNADQEKYGFPASNVSGILERTYADQSLGLLKQILPQAQKIVYISDASSTANLILPRIKKAAADGRLPIEIIAYEQPATMDKWEEAIKKYNADESVSAFLIPLYHTVKMADNGETVLPSDVMKWTVENSKKPVAGLWPFSTDDGALCAVVVDPKEHGVVAGEMALEVLKGKTAGKIPVVENKEGYVIINIKTAQKLNVEMGFDLIETADKVIE